MNRRLKYCCNWVETHRYCAEANSVLPARKHQVRTKFTYESVGLGIGGSVTLYLDGDKISEERVDMTEPSGFSFDESVDVGMEAGSPVSPDYGPRGDAFNGDVNWVEIDVDKEALDQDHILTAEERFHIAMSRQ